MRFLPISPEPTELTTARAKLKATPGVGQDWYKALSTTAKDAVREQRLREQGHLCAYTEIRLTRNRFHIEHMYPRHYCTPEEEIAYHNLVLCFPGEDEDPGFGAVPKKDWPDQSQRSLFVRPVDHSCATRFRFTNDGQMLPTAVDDAPAVETIEQLKLNAPEDPGDPRIFVLRSRRREAVRGVLTGIKSVAEARARLRQQEVADADGRLLEFVSARVQALHHHLDKLSQIQKYTRNV